MKTLKFRCWNGEQMVSPDYITREGLGWWKENSIPTCSSAIMQSTGILDNNGKEIYEFDILQYKYYYVGIKWWSTVSEIPEIEKHTEQGRQNYQIQREIVTYRDGAFKIPGLYLHEINIRVDKLVERLKTGQTSTNDFEEKYWDFEVIGNVFENKNLLDERK